MTYTPNNPNNPYDVNSANNGYDPTRYASNPPSGGNGANPPSYSYGSYDATQRAPENGAYPPAAGAAQPYPQYSQAEAYPPPPYGAYQQPNAGYAPNSYEYAPQMPSAPPPYPQGGGAPAPRSSGKKIWLAVLAAVLLLAGLAAVIAVPLHSAQVASDQARATAQAHQATVTAQTMATATAAAKVYPFSADVQLNDKLVDNGQGVGWTTSQNCAFSNGAYHVTQTQTNMFSICPAVNTNYSNFTYQVSMQIIKGEIGGITFRGDGDNFRYYTFVFSPDSSYALWAYSQPSHPKTLQEGSASSFKTGLGQTNVIGVVARGNTITLYVNGQQIMTTKDTIYSSGQIGMTAYDTTGPADVAFTNAQVWKL